MRFFKPQVLIEIRRLRMFLVNFRSPDTPYTPSGTWVTQIPIKSDICYRYFGDPCYRGGIGCARWPDIRQKHAQSTYLDEYLRFKKNHTEKFLLDFFLEQFEKVSFFFT